MALYMDESESRSVVSNSATPWTILFMDFSRPEYWSGQPFPSPRDLPNQGIEPRSPTLQADSLPAEQNTGVGSLSLLQGIFQIQELNWGLLHCRQILCQLSCQGHGQAVVNEGPLEGKLRSCTLWNVTSLVLFTSLMGDLGRQVPVGALCLAFWLH